MRLSTFPLFICALVAALLLAQPNQALAQASVAPAWNWAHQGTGAWPEDMAVDAAGNTYVVGTLYGTVTMDNGMQLASSDINDADGYLIKYTPAGAVAWAHRLGNTPRYDAAYGVALDATGNVYVSGQFTGQLSVDGFTLSAPSSAAYLVKYDAQGIVKWARQSTGDSPGVTATGQDVELDATGNIYTTGIITWGGATFGSIVLKPAGDASYAHYIAKYDASGTVQWAHTEGSTLSNGSMPSYLAVAPGGEVYLLCSVQKDAIFAGQTYVNRGGTDAYIVKYDALGTHEWVQQLGGPGSDELRRGTVDAWGNLYLPFSFSDQAAVGSTTLHSAGNTDQALLKLNEAGILDWVRTVGGPELDLAQSAALDSYGNIYLMGFFFGTATTDAGATFTSAGHYDALMLSYTRQGALRWSTASGGLNPDDFTLVGFDGGGVGRAVGRYSTTLPLGAITLTAPTSATTHWFVAQFTDKLPAAAPLLALIPSSGSPGQLVTVTGSGFVDVTAVSFNGTPAASFAVQSASRLTAVVPAGATAGPISVRTAAGTGSSATAFTPTVVSSTVTASRVLSLSPNPASHHVVIPGLPMGTHVQLFDALGRVARTTTVSAAAEVSVLGLAPGLYTLRATKQGQPYAARVAVE
jgi:hypothetical protein